MHMVGFGEGGIHGGCRLSLAPALPLLCAAGGHIRQSVDRARSARPSAREPAHVQDTAVACCSIMSYASLHLKVLDPETGNWELNVSWAGGLAQLRRG